VLTEAMQQLGQLSPEARREAGQLLNERKSEVQSLLQERKAELEAAAIHARLQQEHLDVTLPGRREACG
ncbi:phenylalanine--tRNA ligase subunit alpha, partial [Acidithiobacillus ferrooxidans]|nr:phenylalanine--tRNA ligase subunit alpha [Acidithiobacillus ferrooxidans]